MGMDVYITRLLKIQSISVVAGALPSQQKQKVLWKPGLCRTSLPFCTKLKDVPSPVAFSFSPSVHSTVSWSPFSSTIFCGPCSLISIPGGSFHPSSSSGNSCFTLLFLCHNFVQLLFLAWFFVLTTAMTSDRDFFTSKVFSVQQLMSCDGGDAQVL